MLVTAAQLTHSHGDSGAGPGGWALPVLIAAAMILLYLAGVGRLARATRPWPVARTASFVTGALVLAVAVSPPVEALTGGDPRGHMVQHLLIGMYVPIAMVLGAPMTLLLTCLSPGHTGGMARVLRSRSVHVLAHPITAGTIATAGLYVLYLTPLYTVSTDSVVVHHAVHVHFLFSGYLFAWSIAGPDPAPRRPGMPARAGVLIVTAGAHAYLAKLLYARAAELPPGAGHEPDHIQQAAQLMYYGGDIAELALATALFTGWLARRRRDRARRISPTTPPSNFRTAG
ncbi:cytochrome c oxidase assembly protein [Jiangella asiatica]|uniref:Cytochrome c oxidase assembly protein n=2 Tax=Jiangella asiatica TaxID=2530372 RepID=A0A4R5DA84_9ACTN|nr:cytochrome c oxidase assembly protein [Jiangella asiatica]